MQITTVKELQRALIDGKASMPRFDIRISGRNGGEKRLPARLTCYTSIDPVVREIDGTEAIQIDWEVALMIYHGKVNCIDW